MEPLKSTTPNQEKPLRSLEQIQKKGFEVISFDNDDDIIIKGGEEELTEIELKYVAESFNYRSYVILTSYKEKGQWTYWLYTGPTSARLIKNRV